MPTRASALAFYAIFSLPAALIIMLSIAGKYLGNEEAAKQLSNLVKKILSPESLTYVGELLNALTNYAPQTNGSLLSIILLVVSASALFKQLIHTLNVILPKPKKKSKQKLHKEVSSQIFKLIFHRLISFFFLLFITLILFLSFLSETIVAIISDYLSDKIPGSINLIQVGNSIISFILTLALFTFIFKILPDRKIKLSKVIQGALITTLLFILGRYILIYLLQNFVNLSTFGAASTIIFLLIWIFYSAQITFLGAEFIKTFSTEINPPK